MPAQFATIADVIVVYGADTALLAFDREGAADVNDPAVVARADANFQRASAKILSILGGAYEIPDTPPEDTAAYLLSVALDIGIYLAVPRTGEFLQEWKDRYLEHVKALEDIANGDADLPGLDPDPDNYAPSIEAPDRMFYREVDGVRDKRGLV